MKIKNINNINDFVLDTLKSYYPPKVNSKYLDDVVYILMEMLDRGEIYIDMDASRNPKKINLKGWPSEHIKAIKASGWAENDD